MTDKTQRLLLWILAILLVGGTGLALRYARGYRPLTGLSGGSSALTGDVGIRFEKIKVIGRHKGKRAWTITAGRVETSRAQNRFTFSGGIQARLLAVSGRPAALLTAPTAVYDDLLRVLQLSGSIVCKVRDLQVTATDLDWNTGSKQVRCKGPVRATHPRGELNGEQLTINIQTRETTLRNARGRIRVDTLESEEFGL